MQQETGEDNARGEAFWRFSLALYTRPGVAEALIKLQDRAGRDVNLVLFALWLGASRGRRLVAGELAAAEAAIAPIATTVVAPLRRLRRELRATADPAVAALRRRIAGLEVEAERRVQYRLAARFPEVFSVPPAAKRLAAARANLALYLGRGAASPEARLLRRAVAAQIGRPERARD